MNRPTAIPNWVTNDEDTSLDIQAPPAVQETSLVEKWRSAVRSLKKNSYSSSPSLWLRSPADDNADHCGNDSICTNNRW